jgi:hypothetical protein
MEATQIRTFIRPARLHIIHHFTVIFPFILWAWEEEICDTLKVKRVWGSGEVSRKQLYFLKTHRG